MRSLATQSARVVRTLTLHAVKLSDRGKWKTYQYPAEWNLRSQLIAELVPPHSNVFEFGAGPCGLSQYLHPSCALTSSDIVKHRPDVTILDLNQRPLPALGHAESQIAVFAGVLEYVSDVPSILPWVANHFETCIASYECTQSKLGMFRNFRELLDRVSMGWVNHFTEEEFKTLFANAGFDLAEERTWGKHDPGKIFLFKRRPVHNTPESDHSREDVQA